MRKSTILAAAAPIPGLGAATAAAQSTKNIGYDPRAELEDRAERYDRAKFPAFIERWRGHAVAL